MAEAYADISPLATAQPRLRGANIVSKIFSINPGAQRGVPTSVFATPRHVFVLIDEGKCAMLNSSTWYFAAFRTVRATVEQNVTLCSSLTISWWIIGWLPTGKRVVGFDQTTTEHHIDDVQLVSRITQQVRIHYLDVRPVTLFLLIRNISTRMLCVHVTNMYSLKRTQVSFVSLHSCLCRRK